MKQNILDYDFPSDLKNMSLEELNLLAVQIREFLVDNVSKTGGHLASNLGAVELTLALFKYFNPPKDKFIWDVGHQSYVHKILSGRADQFDTLRKFNGLSGFPKTCESEYDVYDTGHSSNSISLAAGFAATRDLAGEDNEIIAIIGDGALTGGLSYEGLNNLGYLKSKAIIILNDNGMSIGQNTGGLSRHLSKVRVSKGYTEFKSGLAHVLKKVPAVGDNLYKGVTKVRDHLKYSLVDGVMFEQLGFTYMGPIDGHNIGELLYNFQLAKASKDSVIMHVVTKKGKGYLNAEKNPSKFHGIGAFDKTSGSILNKSEHKSYSNVFGYKLIELAKKDKKILAISAAMVEGTGLKDFAKEFPNRTFDVGIAEEHAVAFAGAAAKNGFKPVVAIYSTFLQRAYDNIIIDVCLQNAPVIFAIDRAGNVGADGETHHGLFDISYLKNIPNLKVLSPANTSELEKMLEYAVNCNGPIAIRYPRGDDGGLILPDEPLENGALKVSDGADLSIWAVGNMLTEGIKAKEILEKEGISVEVINSRWISPMDETKIKASANSHKYIVTIEDGMKNGGFGESLAAFISNNNLDTKVLNIGWPSQFIEHGSSKELMAKYKIDAAGIAERIKEFIER